MTEGVPDYNIAAEPLRRGRLSIHTSQGHYRQLTLLSRPMSPFDCNFRTLAATS